jgi:hypothetical protein
VAKLTTNEKEILEELFQMHAGYVLNFSDRTFGEFFQNEMALNIFDPKYNYASGSKANRLPNWIVRSICLNAALITVIERLG